LWIYTDSKFKVYLMKFIVDLTQVEENRPRASEPALHFWPIGLTLAIVGLLLIWVESYMP